MIIMKLIRFESNSSYGPQNLFSKYYPKYKTSDLFTEFEEWAAQDIGIFSIIIWAEICTELSSVAYEEDGDKSEVDEEKHKTFDRIEIEEDEEGHLVLPAWRDLKLARQKDIFRAVVTRAYGMC